jgi:periplasmic divalent cation tolerance protein
VTDLIQVMTTVDSREEAQNIAQALVQRRLAGCVQVIGPLTSVYRWQEEIATDEEWLCIAKSHRDLYPELEKTLRQIHPYDVPEILAMPVVAGNPDYLAWLTSELQR